MDLQTTALAIIAIPLLGSLLIPILGWLRQGEAHRLRGRGPHRHRPRADLDAAGPGASAGTVTSCQIPFYRAWCNLSLTIDALAVFMAFTASLIATLIAIYSLGYIEHDEHEPEYYFIVTLFLGAMMGLVFSTNLIFLYTFWEISALACWRLIGYYREPDYVWKADKAFLITFGGAVLMLLGFGLDLRPVRHLRDRRSWRASRSAPSPWS